LKDRNILKGMFLIAIALAFGLGALKYPVGRLERAGPGFFPLLVSSILLLLGVAMVVRSRFTERKPIEFSFRNLSLIMASLCGFALLSHYVNMSVGIAFLVFVSAYAGQTYSVKRNVILTIALIGIAFIFDHGLGLQLHLFRYFGSD